MHERFTLLMSLHLDALATPGEELELERHLGVCPACAAVWRDWQSMHQLLAEAPTVVPPRDLAAEVSRRLRRQTTREVQPALLPLGLFVLEALSLVTSCAAIARLLWWEWLHPVDVAVSLSSATETWSQVRLILAEAGTLLSALGRTGWVALLAIAICMIMSAGFLLLGVGAACLFRSSTEGLAKCVFDPAQRSVNM